MDNPMFQNAEKIFKKYKGNHYQMMREGEYDVYKSFRISQETELMWLLEMQSVLLDNMKNTSNNKLIGEYFSDYGSIATQLKDAKGLQYMFNYLNGKYSNFDSNTILRAVNSVLNNIKIFNDVNLKSDIIKECIVLLKTALNKPIFISDDYQENGHFPDYLSPERIKANIENTIKYWESSV